MRNTVIETRPNSGSVVNAPSARATILFSLSVSAALFLLIIAAPVSAQQKKTKTDKALEKQLADDLLGGLDDIPQQAKREKGVNPQRAGEDIRLGPQKESPLLALGRRMREAEERISLGDTGKQTQLLQKNILAQLDAMIEKTCKKCSGGSSASAQKTASKGGPGKPGKGTGDGKAAAEGPQKSTDRLDKGKVADAKLDSVKKTMYRVWGHLPPRVQKQMRAAAAERFMPQYERLIELYYKRLAEDLNNTP